MVASPFLEKLAHIASEKVWPRENLTPEEILDILLSNPRSANLKYDKIDTALVEIKRLNDPRYVNVVTARKIEKTDKKLNKFYFDDKLRLCCPKDNEDCWNEAVKYYSTLIEDEIDDEYSDQFEWASDESESFEDTNCWDYITPEILTTKNYVKNFFF